MPTEDATSVAWHRWGNIKRTKYETAAAGYTMRPGWLMLYPWALWCRMSHWVELLARVPFPACVSLHVVHIHAQVSWKTAKCCDNSAEADHPGAEYRPATVWMVSEASQSGGWGQCSHCKWWMEAATALGRPLHNPSGGRRGCTVCQESCFIHKPSVQVKFNPSELGCVVLHRCKKQRKADEPLGSTFLTAEWRAPVRSRRAENPLAAFLLQLEL